MIKNFKTIDNAIISFEDHHLTVLDGPNGFGKTTVFDSIELALTGKIKRIQNNRIAVNSRGYNDYLFAKDQEKPVEIIIELKAEGEYWSKVFVFGRRIDPTELRPIGKKPTEFNFNLHKLKSIDDKMTEENRIDDNLLEEIFEVKDIVERYNLYHYIEQEDSSYLLKRNEKERIDVISKLFNIDKEYRQKEKLEKARNLLRKELRKISEKVNELKKYTDDYLPQKSMMKIDYIQLLPHTNLRPWDDEKLVNLDKSKKDTYIKELNLIKELKVNLNLFQKQKKNNQISTIIAKRERISALIILGHFDNKFETLKNEYMIKNSLKKYLKILEERKILTEFIDWMFIINTLNLDIDINWLKEKIENITFLNKSSNSLSNILKKLINARENLKNQFYFYINNEDNAESYQSCPYCGHNYENYHELEKHMHIKTEELQKDLDLNSKKVLEEIESLYNSTIHEIIKTIKTYLSDRNIIQDDFFLQLQEYKNLGVDISKAKDFLNNLGIDFEKYVNKEKAYIRDLEERTIALIAELEACKKVVDQKIIDNYKDYQDILENIFENNLDLIQNLKIEDIEQKKKYIEYTYFEQSSQIYNNLKKLIEKKEIINNYYLELEQIVSVYNKKINSHRGKMISDIEIPFFIYSGKIIQNHQRGIGVFINEIGNQDENGEFEVKAINFVPPEETDHDIVHTFSSGQLSATVLALTLALNKVYNKSGLNAILIDDPTQAMDEINIASFVELLRNDFADKQIILSTHEENISLYIRYKFSKFGLNTTNINVKKHFYNNN